MKLTQTIFILLIGFSLSLNGVVQADEKNDRKLVQPRHQQPSAMKVYLASAFKTNIDGPVAKKDAILAYSYEVVRDAVNTFPQISGSQQHFPAGASLEHYLLSDELRNKLAKRFAPRFGNKIQIDPLRGKIWEDILRLIGPGGIYLKTAAAYEKFHNEILWPQIKKVSANKGNFEEGQLSIEVGKKKKDPRTGKSYREYTYKIHDGPPITLRTEMLKAAEGLKLGYKGTAKKIAIEAGKSIGSTSKVFPAQTAGFAATACLIAGFETVLRPGFVGYDSVPTDMKTACSQFFHKDTFIDIPATANFWVFMYSHNVADKAMLGLYNTYKRHEDAAKKYNDKHWDKKLLPPTKVDAAIKFFGAQMKNFIGLGLGSFVSGLTSDLLMFGKDCTMGYYSREPTDPRDIEIWKTQREQCDLAYDRYIRGEIYDTHLGHIPALGLGAFLSAVHRLAIDKAIISTAIARMSFKGSNVAAKLEKAFSTIGKGKVIPMVYSLGLFMTYEKLFGHHVADPFRSFLVSRNVDKSEDKLFWDMHTFKARNWNVHGKKTVKECKNPKGSILGIVELDVKMRDQHLRKYSGVLKQQLYPAKVPYALPSESEEVCYDNTVFESIHNYHAYQAQWRGQQLEAANEAHFSHMEGVTNLTAKYMAAKSVYTDFIHKVKNRSSLIFADENPLAGTPGFVIEGNEVKRVADDGSRSLEEMQDLQMRNVEAQGRSLDILISMVERSTAKITKNVQELLTFYKEIRDLFLSEDAVNMKKGIDLLESRAKHYSKWCGKVTLTEVESDLTKEFAIDIFGIDLSKMKNPGNHQATKPEKAKGAIYYSKPSNYVEKNPKRNTFTQQKVNEAATMIGLSRKVRSDAKYLPCVAGHLLTYLYSTFEGRDPLILYAQSLNDSLIANKYVSEDLDKPVGYMKGLFMSDQIFAHMACGVETAAMLKEENSRHRIVRFGAEVKSTISNWFVGDEEHISQPKGWAKNIKLPRVTTTNLKNDVCNSRPHRLPDPGPYEGNPNDKNKLAAYNKHKEAVRIYNRTQGAEFTDSTRYFSTYNWDKRKDTFSPNDRYKTRYKNIIHYLRNNIRKEVLNDVDGWWADTMGVQYDRVTEAVKVNYNKVLVDKFAPAIYGEREYMKQSSPEACFGEASLPKGMSEGNLGQSVIEADIETAEMFSEEDERHPDVPKDPEREKMQEFYVDEDTDYQFPPKYFSRRQIRTCETSRRHYAPVVVSLKLEFEMFINEVLRPIYRSQFVGEFEKDLLKAMELFNQRAEKVNNELEKLMDYRAYFYQEKHIGDISNERYRRLLSAIFAFKMDMGLMHPKESILLGRFEGESNELDQVSEQEARSAFNQGNYVTVGDDFELAEGQKLEFQKDKKYLPNWRQFRTVEGFTDAYYVNPYIYATVNPSVNQDFTRPYYNLTKDQQAIVTITVAKMAATAQEAFNFHTIINELDK